ncbi:MAG: hypothetical protein KGJ23_14635 [Euryarchaeota archaeon]|nr:hypothetical protein [Euryarchaeota archaeon]MDE1837837.1 hypothetical protein [Euryarchaeota archaeon]MDE1880111.1 hypothetical protein [Euryarchaeota archaeon]MDE2045051.1 hypothetical protein [Thermoplasmata archaeon]
MAESPRDWAKHPFFELLEKAEREISRRHPAIGNPPVTAEEMAQEIAGKDWKSPPSGSCVLADYTPIHLPAPAPTLISAIGDLGSVGSTLKCSSDYLAPAKSPPLPVHEVVLWARKWETRYWATRPGPGFEGKRVWLKLWGVPGVLLQP